MLYPQLLGIYGDLEFDRDVFINNQTAILDNLYDIIVLKNNSVINFSKTAFYIASFLAYNNQYNTLLHQVMTMMSKDPLYGPLNDKESKKAVKILKAYHYRNSLPGFISIPGGGISIDKTGLLESIDITIYAAKDDAMRKKKRKNSSNVK